MKGRQNVPCDQGHFAFPEAPLDPSARSTCRAVKRLLLALEMGAIYGAGPLLVLMVRQPGVLFAVLWLGASGALVSIRKRSPKPHLHDLIPELLNILLRFTILAPLFAFCTWWISPEYFLRLPRQDPRLWLLIMGLYPLLSVWPQEVLYRAFLFERYHTLLPTAFARITASAQAFGFAYIIFLNWFAIILTTAGGALFALDYERHRSLRLTCLEHSLYGCLIFTLGLGRFFYTGTAWHQG